MTNLWNCSDPFGSPPFLFGGSLRVTQKGTHMCHPEPCEGSLWEYRQNLNRDPSKAREDLPCLQGVKRVRRNRRRMGVCPWQLVAESASFSAADYRAQASGEIFGKILREFYTVCLATLTAYNPRAAGQRPIRLAAVPSRRLAQGDTIVTLCHPEPCEGSLWEYRQNLKRDPSTARRLCRRSAQDDTRCIIINCAWQNDTFA